MPTTGSPDDSGLARYAGPAIAMHPAVVSVSPYPLPGETFPAKSLPMRRMVSGDGGAPPCPMDVSDEMSCLSRSGCSRRERTTVGTPPICDTRCFSISRSASPASHLNWFTIVPPNAVWLIIPHRPAMWKNGNVESDTAGGGPAGTVSEPAIRAASAVLKRAFQVFVT